MIKNTFIFLPKVGITKERQLWEKGIVDWDKFLSAEKIPGISSRAKKQYDLLIRDARKALYEGDSSYFYRRLPQSETWRLYKSFLGESVFLDIETSGTGKKSFITVVGLFDGLDTKIMVRGINLDLEELKKAISGYKLIITFNGSSFDLPFLEKRLPGIASGIPVIDLRHTCSKIGLTGGLKDIEKKLGIFRNNPAIDKLYGGDPIKLWRMFRGLGDDYYLRLLIEYNEEDIINLKMIAEHSINILEKGMQKYFCQKIFF